MRKAKTVDAKVRLFLEKIIVQIKTQSGFEPDDWLSMNFISKLILLNKLIHGWFWRNLSRFHHKAVLNITGLSIGGKLY